MGDSGTAVWVRCRRRAWTRGVLEERSEDGAGKWAFKVRKLPVDDDSDDSHDGFDEEDEFVTVTGDSPEVSGHADLFLCNQFDDGRTLADVEDLTWLTHLHEPSILQALSDRFDRDKIYTNTGPILLAVNPFKRIKLYTDELLEMYYSTGLLKSQGLEAPSLPPHVYATGDSAYRSLVDTSEQQGAKNQSILVSGESGAGKTESTKFIMQYLATVARDDKDSDGQKIADMVLQSNPILEAFGNARTNRNDNSSRFGKFIEMQFNTKGMLVGARIVTYLLEKVRLAKQGIGERNFHVFYQLCRGASEDQLKAWRVPDLDECGYTNQSECLDRKDGVEDDDQFERMWKAMETMGFPDEEKEQLMQIVSSVMNLGNLEFLPDDAAEDGEGCVLSDESAEAVAACAALLQVEEDALATALKTRRIKAGTEWFTKKLSPEEAADARDALSKTIYSRMFDRVVLRVNQSIQVSSKVKTNFIGVLDIFGFEVFQSNSFEQLCINYANETLQQQFNQFVFKLEQREYEKEKIKWSFIDFPDNQQCLDLIEAKPIGLISLLDEQCLFPQGNDKSLAGRFYEKLVGVDRFSVSNKEKVANQFTVEHYAGNVTYDTYGFVAKNKDQLYQEAMDLMQSSANPLMAELFPKPKKSANAAAQGDNKRSLQSKTVGSQFKEQLGALLKTIRSTSPHYIRCLKPNDVAAAGKIVRSRLVDQLRYGGVLEAVKVARAGYPVRMLLADFVSRYFMLGEGGKVLNVVKARTDGDGKPAAVKLVEAQQLEPDVEYQVGRTKLFLRKGAYEKIEETRLACLKARATHIQAAARASADRQAYLTKKRAVFKLQAVARGMLGRSRATHVRQTNAATRLQAFARKALACAYRRKAMRAVLTIQNAHRGAVARSQSKALRRDKALLLIQAWARARPARSAFTRRRRLVVRIQTMVRAALARMERKRLKIEAGQVDTLRVKMQDLQARVKELEAELDEQRQVNKELEGKVAAAAATAVAGAGVAAVATTAAVATGPSPEEVQALTAQLESKDAELAAALERAQAQEAALEDLRNQVEAARAGAMAGAGVGAVAAAAATASAAEAPPPPAPSSEELDQLRAQLAAAQRENEVLRAGAKAVVPDEDKTASMAGEEEDETKTISPSARSASAGDDDVRIKQLEAQVSELQAALEEARASKPEQPAGDQGRLETQGVEEASSAAAAATAEEEAHAPQPQGGNLSAEEELGGLRDQIMALEMALADEKAENERLSAESTSAAEAAADGSPAAEEKGKMVKQIDTLEKENQDLIAQLETHIGRMCDAENRANEIQNEYVKVRKANKNLEDKLQAMEELHKQASGVKIALARRLEALILENRTLRQDKTEVEDVVTRLQQENQILRARN